MKKIFLLVAFIATTLTKQLVAHDTKTPLLQ